MDEAALHATRRCVLWVSEAQPSIDALDMIEQLQSDFQLVEHTHPNEAIDLLQRLWELKKECFGPRASETTESGLQLVEFRNRIAQVQFVCAFLKGSGEVVMQTGWGCGQGSWK